MVREKSLIGGGIVFLLLFLSPVASAQSRQIVSESLLLPPAPESAMLVRSVTHPSALWCGGVDISVPLYSAASRSIAVDIRLHYQSSGNKIGDLSGSVGLGWRLSAGGRITRVVRGLPDEPGQNPVPTSWGNTQFESWLNRDLDSEPDMYFYEFGGRRGMFVFDETGKAFTLPYTALRIELLSGDYFRVTDESGCQYTFGVTAKDITTANMTGGQICDPYTSTWYLEKILSPSGDVMELTYYKESLTHIFSENYSHCLFPTNNSIGQTSSTFTYTMQHKQYYGNLKSVSWRGGGVECFYSAQSGGSPMKKLDEIRILGVQNEYLYSLVPEYGHFESTDSAWRPLKLQSVGRRGATDRLQVARFDYYEAEKLPPSTSLDVDHWGYYNKAGNTIRRPRITYNGVRLFGAERTPLFAAAQAGMLKRTYSIYGGFTEYGYELNTTASGQNGGLRVVSIRQATDDSDPGQTTRFRYVLADGNTSSGQSFRELDENALYVGPQNTEVSSENRHELRDVAGFTTGYSRVEEQLPNGSSRVYNYTFAGGVVPDVRTVPGGATVARNDTFFPVVMRFGEQGMLTSCISYDANGNEVERESYTYTANAPAMATIRGYFPLKAPNDARGNSSSYYVGSYTLTSRNVLPVSVSRTGANVVNHTIAYTRDAATLMATEVTTTTPLGDTYMTRLRYPFQFNVASVPASAPDAYAVRVMNEDHVLNIPVEEIAYKNNRVVGGILNTCRVMTTENSARSIVPAAIYELKLTSSLSSYAPVSFSSAGTMSRNAAYKPSMWFDNYDRWGNLLQCHEENGKPVSYVYEYDHSIATAEITGAEAHDGSGGKKLNEVFYTSFEEDPQAVIINAKTGRKARKGPVVIPSGHFKNKPYSSGGGARPPYIYQGETPERQEYIVTWWGSLDNGRSWEPYRSTYSSPPVNGFEVGTSAHYVDEVSILPKDATIVTSTWIAGRGQITQSDGNGYTTYYEYDSYGRPTAILNNKKQKTNEFYN